MILDVFNRNKSDGEEGVSSGAGNIQTGENVQKTAPSFGMNQESSEGGKKESSEKEQSSSDKQWSFSKVLYYAFVLLLPLFYLPFTLSPVALSKQIFVGAILLVLTIYVLGRLLARGELSLPPKMLLFASFGFAGAVLISALFSQAQNVSLLGTSADSFFWVAMYVLAFILTVVVVNNRQAIKNTAIAFAGGVGIFAILTMLQFSDIMVFPGFLDNTNFNPVGTVFAAGFVVAVAFVGFTTYLLIASPKDKSLQGVLWAFVALFGLFLIQINLWTLWLSLGLAFVGIAGVVGYKAVRQKEANLRPLVVPLFIVMVATLGVIIQPNIPTFMNVPAEIGPSLGSTWDISTESLEGARHVTGTGPGTFPFNYSLNRPIALNQTNFWGVQFNQGYSAALTYLSTWGILGIFAFLGTLLLFLYRIGRTAVNNMHQHREGENDSVLRGIALASFGVTLFLSLGAILYKSNVVLFLLLFISAGLAISSMAQLGWTKRWRISLLDSPQKMLIISLSAIVLLSVSLGGLYFVGQKYIGRVYVAQAVESYRANNDLQASLNALDNAIQTSPNDDFTYRVATQALTLQMRNIVQDQSLSQQERSQRFTEVMRRTINVAQRARDANPREVQNWSQLARVYEQLVGIADQAEEQAIAAYEEARNLDPNNPSLPLAQARVNVLAADNTQRQINQFSQTPGQGAAQQEELVNQRKEYLQTAVDRLREAIDLKSDYSAARFLLAATYQRLGNLEQAITQTEQIVNQNRFDPNVWFQLGLYQYQAEQYNNAKDSLEQAVSLADDQFANARYYLGLSYAELGNTESAVNEFETLQENNPDNQLVSNILTNLREGNPPLQGVGGPQTSPPVEDEGGSEGPVLPPEGEGEDGTEGEENPE